MDEYNFAGFWIRVAAALIDTVLLSIVIGIPLTLIYGSEYWTSEELVMGFWDAVFYIVPVVITVWFWVKYLGTPGSWHTGEDAFAASCDRLQYRASNQHRQGGRPLPRLLCIGDPAPAGFRLGRLR
jgi:hypothetical protein